MFGDMHSVIVRRNDSAAATFLLEFSEVTARVVAFNLYFGNKRTAYCRYLWARKLHELIFPLHLLQILQIQ